MENAWQSSLYLHKISFLGCETLHTCNSDLVKSKCVNILCYLSAPDGVVSKESLDEWVNGERYLAFPRINGGQLNEMSDMNKRIVLIITNEKEDDEITKSKIDRYVHSSFDPKFKQNCTYYLEIPCCIEYLLRRFDTIALIDLDNLYIF